MLVDLGGAPANVSLELVQKEKAASMAKPVAKWCADKIGAIRLLSQCGIPHGPRLRFNPGRAMRSGLVTIPRQSNQRKQIENFPGRRTQRIFFSMWIRPKDSRRTCFSPATDVIGFRRLNHKPQTKSQDKITIAAP
jgi:hypothetical protein